MKQHSIYQKNYIKKKKNLIVMFLKFSDIPIQEPVITSVTSASSSSTTRSTTTTVPGSTMRLPDSPSSSNNGNGSSSCVASSSSANGSGIPRPAHSRNSSLDMRHNSQLVAQGKFYVKYYFLNSCYYLIF